MKLQILIIVLLLTPLSVLAHGDETFAQAEGIIEQKIPCEELNESQLEILGDYYMEQMHPGDAHTQMDEMMGGEGSESLRLMHIRMAESFYCGNHEEASGSMMDTMMGRDGMMNNDIEPCGEVGCDNHDATDGSTMMNGYNMGMGSGFFTFFWFILATVVFSLIFWGTYTLMIKGGKK